MACIPFSHSNRVMCLLEKGAQESRRELARTLTPDALAAVGKQQGTQPNFDAMQELYDAGLRQDPLIGMPLFNPRKCNKELLEAIGTAYQSVATAINEDSLGSTLDELETLKKELIANIKPAAIDMRLTIEDVLGMPIGLDGEGEGEGDANGGSGAAPVAAVEE